MSTRQYSNYADLITFSRASGGTALRPVSYGDELVTNGTFDTDTSGWSVAGDASLSVNNGALRVTSGSDADRYASQTLSVEVGKVYQFSFDFVAIDGAIIELDARLGTAVPAFSYFREGALVSGDEGTYTKTFVATDANLAISFVFDNATTGEYFEVDNISIKEVLFDQPTAPLTLFNHPANIPRIEYDADGNRLGLLVEEQRTNLVTYSDVDTTNWSGGDSVNISTESVLNPFGFSSLVKVVPTTDTQGNASNRTVKKSINVTTGTTHTYSAFVKAAGYNAAYIIFTDRANVYGGVAYDLSTASLIELDGPNTGTLSNPFIEDFGDGWYRIGFSHDGGGAIDATNGVGVGFVPTGLVRTVNYTQSSFAGDGVSGGYVAGVQVEAGSFPTSYIPTSGSTATRAVDAASIPVADFGFNADAGTFVVEFDFTDPENDDNNYVMGGTASARIIYNNAGNSLWQTYDGNAAVTFGNLDNTGSDRFKAAVGVKTGKDVATVLNGNVKGSSTSATDLMSNLKGGDISLGGGSDSQKLNGHIKSINYYPRQLTNAQLQELTS